MIGGVRIFTTSPITLSGEPGGVLLVGQLPVDKPLVADGLVAVSDGDVRRVETALEQFVSLVAVDRRVTHSVSSPMPYVGFGCSSAAALHELDGLRVDRPCVTGSQQGQGGAGLLEPPTLEGLQDRLDGVMLLAEAINQRTGLGEYLQLLRVFERAFRLGPFDLTGPLATFLASGCQGFAEPEVSTWTQVRGAAAHADRREEFVLTADVAPFVPRMREAAYDVLLNKSEWRSRSATRREQWKAASGSADAAGGIFVTQGSAATLAFQFRDGHAQYPLLLSGPAEGALPLAAWLEGGVDGGKLRICGDWRPQS